MLKALVVEDEEDIKQLLLEELEDKGYEVLLADDGEAALQRLSQEIPDVMFVDIYMPVMDGLELITRIKGDPATARIPVVMVTIMNALATEKKARELGVEHYLTKPWESGELDRILDQVFKLDSQRW